MRLFEHGNRGCMHLSKICRLCLIAVICILKGSLYFPDTGTDKLACQGLDETFVPGTSMPESLVKLPCKLNLPLWRSNSARTCHIRLVWNQEFQCNKFPSKASTPYPPGQTAMWIEGGFEIRWTSPPVGIYRSIRTRVFRGRWIFPPGGIVSLVGSNMNK